MRRKHKLQSSSDEEEEDEINSNIGSDDEEEDEEDNRRQFYRNLTQQQFSHPNNYSTGSINQQSPSKLHATSAKNKDSEEEVPSLFKRSRIHKKLLGKVDMNNLSSDNYRTNNHRDDGEMKRCYQ